MSDGIYDFIDNKHYIVTNSGKMDITELVTKTSPNMLSGDSIKIQDDKIIVIKPTNQIIYGILNTNSKVSYGNTKNSIKRKFFPFMNGKKFPDFIVSSQKENQVYDYYACIKLEKWDNNNTPIGTIVEIIGKIGDYDVEQTFLTRTCMSCWKNIKFNIQDYLTDITPNRIDYTNFDTYSIDPNNCIDIDDAFHIVKNKDYYEVGIHIADVSSYIKHDSQLDKELCNRCETIYLPNKQINMIPDNLSVEYMSLKKNKISRAYSVILKIDFNGNIISHNLCKTLIKLKDNLSYEQSELDIKNNTNKDLVEIYNLTKKIQKNRPNSNINTDNYDTHVMIEILMVIANSLVGEILYKTYKDGALLRKHNGLKNNNNPKQNQYNMQRAEYCFAKDNFNHVGLGEQYYTHFTSPIRRYADILVHRQLTKITDIDYKQLHIMNCIQKKYHKIKRQCDLINFVYKHLKYDQEYIEVTGIIVFINNNKAIIHIDKENLDIETIIFPHKLKHLLEIKQDYSSIVLNGKIKLELNQPVKLRIGFTKNNKQKINSVIYEPDVYSLY
jgi:exoribonuclease R